MEIEVNQLLIVPIILGLVEIAKKFSPPAQFLPVLALLLGIIGAFVFPEPRPELTVVKGLVFGLAASGLWSQSTTLARR